MLKDDIKKLIAEYQTYVKGVTLYHRDIEIEEGMNYVFVGLRHAGKSYMMYQHIQKLISDGHSPDEILYFNFEDDRIDSLDTSLLETIKECYEEMYDSRPIFFLDEIQLVERWEKFARRLADQKYRVFITGSNAKMLSAEIATTLGGRYLIHEVFPLHFGEYLTAHAIDMHDRNAIYKHGREIIALAENYFKMGGLPETALMSNNRQWLSSLFSKIFFGDIITRHKVRNESALKILIRKLAESVKQPLSYNRMSTVVASTGRKMSVDAVIEYVDYMTESWLILPYENYHGKLHDKETNKKYYFIDNGILSLFLIDPNTSLLENVVAIALRRKYADRCYFYNDSKNEVDFYVDEENIAIQVAYSLQDEPTRSREFTALCNLTKHTPCQQLIVVTKDEEEEVDFNGNKIRVIPMWKFLLEI